MISLDEKNQFESEDDDSQHAEGGNQAMQQPESTEVRQRKNEEKRINSILQVEDEPRS